jgi:hypothetical protein
MLEEDKRMTVLRWFALLLLLVPALTQAQDESSGLTSNLTGTYHYEGLDDGTEYTGVVTIDGTGPLYWLTYTDTVNGEEFSESFVAQGQGNLIIAAIEGEACYPATLVRQSDGTLFGFWYDFDTGPTAMGTEMGVPQGETDGFPGVYEMVGSYADGTQYRATLTLTENEGGWYDLTYSYHYDELYPEGERVDDTGIGMVVGNVLGYAYTSQDEHCGAYVIDLGGEGFEAVFVDTDRHVGSETGARAE